MSTVRQRKAAPSQPQSQTVYNPNLYRVPPRKKKYRWMQRLLAFVIITVVGLRASGRYHDALRKEVEPPGQVINLSDDTHFHIQCFDPAHNEASQYPTVILLHGVGGNSMEWGVISKDISRHVRVCAIDRVIYSDYPRDTPRDCEQITSEMHTILQKAEVPPPYVLVGHSYGGFISQNYAYKYPSEVSGLVLVDSGHEDEPELFAKDPVSPLSAANFFFNVFGFMSRYGFLRLLGHFEMLPMPPTAAYPQASRSTTHLLYSDPAVWDRTIDELTSINKSANIIKELRKTNQFKSDLPIAAITTTDRPPEKVEAYLDMHSRVVKLSTKGTHLQAKTDHFVHLRQPSIVIEAIMGVLEHNGYSIS